MNKCNCKDLDNLIKKVQQQENTITQLVGIIANTNNKVACLSNKDRGSRSVFKQRQ